MTRLTTSTTFLALVALQCLCTGTGLTSQAAPDAATDTRAPGTAELPRQGATRIAWIGDSITQACRYTCMVEDFLLTRRPEEPLQFWNAGVSGDRAGHVLERFDADIAPFAPTHAFVMLGMNDGEVQDWSAEVFAIFERDLSALVWRLAQVGTACTLLAPTPFDAAAYARKRPGRPVPFYDHVLVRYGEWMQRLAAERSLGFVDTHRGLRAANSDLQRVHPSTSLIPDGVHPGELGSAFVALDVVLGAFEGRDERGHVRPRGALHIVHRDGKPEFAQTKGIESTALAPDEDGIRFDGRMTTLPWVLAGEREELMRLSPEYRALNSFVLRVEGLSEGSYWLTIDGHRAILRTAGQWAQGVDIGLLRLHPDYHAAARIAALNEARNTRIREGIRELRYTYKVIPYYARIDPDKEREYREEKERLERDWAKNLQKIAQFRAAIDEARHPTRVRYGIERHR